MTERPVIQVLDYVLAKSGSAEEGDSEGRGRVRTAGLHSAWDVFLFERGSIALNFILMSHATWSLLMLGGLWAATYWTLWTTYTVSIFLTIFVLFLIVTWAAVTFASNISFRRLTFRSVGSDFDWHSYARVRLAFLVVIFGFNCSLLIWATGGMESPFIPFYIMVFIVALNYCTFPQPAMGLTLTFVSFFLFFIFLAEVPWARSFIPLPIDSETQEIIHSLGSTKLLDVGFAVASMLVPFISIFLATRKIDTTIDRRNGGPSDRTS